MILPAGGKRFKQNQWSFKTKPKRWKALVVLQVPFQSYCLKPQRLILGKLVWLIKINKIFHLLYVQNSCEKTILSTLLTKIFKTICFCRYYSCIDEKLYYQTRIKSLWNLALQMEICKYLSAAPCKPEKEFFSFKTHLFKITSNALGYMKWSL